MTAPAPSLREKVACVIRANVRTEGWGGTLTFTGVENSVERILALLSSPDAVPAHVGEATHMMPDLAELRREIQRVRYERDDEDRAGYAINAPCEADDYGAREVPVYPDGVRSSVLALLDALAAARAREAGLKRAETVAVHLADTMADRVNALQARLDEAEGLLRMMVDAYAKPIGRESDASEPYAIRSARAFLATEKNDG